MVWGAMSRRWGAVAVAVGLIVAASPGALARSVRDATRVPGAQVGFWAGETTTHCAATDPNFCPRDNSNYTPAIWQVLRATRSVLYMNFVYEADFGPVPVGEHQRSDVLPLVRRANQLGVPVDVWITFPISLGTYADEENATTVEQAVRAFYFWSRQHKLAIGETVLDLEQATGDQPVADALGGNLSTIEQTMHANIDPAGQCRALITYRDTISWAHEHAMRLTGTPVPFSMDDVILDHNMGLTDALDMPPYVPGMYDELYLQAYRTYGELGSAYIARYYRIMQHYFGSKGQISLGGTGQPPYTALGPIVTDVRMLAGMGALAIPIFDLDGTVNTFGVSGTRAIIEAGHEPLSGSQLAAAENSSTPQGNGAIAFFNALNTAANVATLGVTAAEGHPSQPNQWPYGCGHIKVVPLR